MNRLFARSPCSRPSVLLVPASIVIAWLIAVGPLKAQESANAELDECMRNAAISGAAVGGVLGALAGAILGGDRRRAQGAIIGGVAGGTAGGVIAWRNAWKSCSSKFATASTYTTRDYEDTARRYKYGGNGVLLKIEQAGMPSSVSGGAVLPVDLRYVLLTPDARDSTVTIRRNLACANENSQLEQIPVEPEVVTVRAGTHVSQGKIQMPRVPPEIGSQTCRMTVVVEAEGLRDGGQKVFTLTPG
jgi:hypothetical protein